MGTGHLRERNKVRATQFNQLLREAQRLEAENKELKTNPEGVVGKFLSQLNLLGMQNSKLSALAAALIETGGGTAVVQKALIDSFGSTRVIIKVEGNADTEEAVTEYRFTYEKEAVPDSNKTVTVADATPASPEATVIVNEEPESR